MNKLVCEMCQSNDMVKQDGYFVCQACGTKYTVEEAKKLMIEGTVDVSGSTVKVDNTSFVQKSLENARRAKAKEDWEECEKYYNMVEQHEPKNIEAIFFSAYGKAKMGMVDSDRFKREQKVNVLKNSISVIDDNYDNSPEKYEENKKLITDMHEYLMKMVNGNFVYNAQSNGYGVKNDSYYTINMFVALCLGWIESLENIIKVISNSKDTVYLLKFIEDCYRFCWFKSINKSYRSMYAGKINNTMFRIRELEPGYKSGENVSTKNNNNSAAIHVAIIAGLLILVTLVIGPTILDKIF